MTFKDVRLPTGLSYGASGGPGYNTDIITLDSGHEQRNQNWSASRNSYDVGRTCDTDAKRIALISFFRIMKGKAHSFRLKDFTDFEVLTGEGVLSSLGAGQYQLYKRYTTSDASTEDRLISLPLTPVIKQGAATLILNTNYTLASTTGIITVIGSPTPAPDSWTGQFDVPVRFDTDTLRLVLEDIQVFRTQSIPIVEVRV